MKYTAFLLLFAALALPAAAQPSAGALPACTAAQHDAYSVTGPDGVKYPTWHPQIDPQAHCTFGHEHGSDPGAILPSVGFPYTVSPAAPPFGYAAAKMGMAEAHQGFKVFAFNDRNGHLWRIAVHMGSAGAGRVCTRFHEVDVAIWDAATWERLADTHFMGDFGAAMSNQGQDLTPTACPTQAADARAAGSQGVRMFRVFSQNGSLYDPWRLDDAMLTAIPLNLHFLTIWPNSINDCADLTCDVLQPNIGPTGPNDGIEHFFQYYPGMGIKAGGNTGTFYTDPMGMAVRAATDADAVRQYVKPGATFALPEPAGKCFPWGAAMVYHCGGQSDQYYRKNYSGAVVAPN